LAARRIAGETAYRMFPPPFRGGFSVQAYEQFELAHLNQEDRDKERSKPSLPMSPAPAGSWAPAIVAAATLIGAWLSGRRG
jgi:hypothetical protein